MTYDLCLTKPPLAFPQSRAVYVSRWRGAALLSEVLIFTPLSEGQSEKGR